jgi:hypothetical protein
MAEPTPPTTDGSIENLVEFSRVAAERVKADSDAIRGFKRPRSLVDPELDALFNSMRPLETFREGVIRAGVRVRPQDSDVEVAFSLLVAYKDRNREILTGLADWLSSTGQLTPVPNEEPLQTIRRANNRFLDLHKEFVDLKRELAQTIFDNKTQRQPEDTCKTRYDGIMSDYDEKLAKTEQQRERQQRLERLHVQEQQGQMQKREKQERDVRADTKDKLRAMYDELKYEEGNAQFSSEKLAEAKTKIANLTQEIADLKKKKEELAAAENIKTVQAINMIVDPDGALATDSQLDVKKKCEALQDKLKAYQKMTTDLTRELSSVRSTPLPLGPEALVDRVQTLLNDWEASKCFAIQIDNKIFNRQNAGDYTVNCKDVLEKVTEFVNNEKRFISTYVGFARRIHMTLFPTETFHLSPNEKLSATTEALMKKVSATEKKLSGLVANELKQAQQLQQALQERDDARTELTVIRTNNGHQPVPGIPQLRTPPVALPTAAEDANSVIRVVLDKKEDARGRAALRKIEDAKNELMKWNCVGGDLLSDDVLKLVFRALRIGNVCTLGDLCTTFVADCDRMTHIPDCVDRWQPCFNCKDLFSLQGLKDHKSNPSSACYAKPWEIVTKRDVGGDYIAEVWPMHANWMLASNKVPKGDFDVLESGVVNEVINHVGNLWNVDVKVPHTYSHTTFTLMMHQNYDAEGNLVVRPAVAGVDPKQVKVMFEFYVHVGSNYTPVVQVVVGATTFEELTEKKDDLDVTGTRIMNMKDWLNKHPDQLRVQDGVKHCCSGMKVTAIFNNLDVR